MTWQQQLAAILHRILGNDSYAQRSSLMETMRKTGYITLHEAMRVLDVYDPRPRIHELYYKHGAAIMTATFIEQTEAGVSHKIGVHFLTNDKGYA
jgi:hypothetical protein